MLCAYPNGQCAHSAAAGGLYCVLHSCQCGQYKRSKSNSCDACTSPSNEISNQALTGNMSPSKGFFSNFRNPLHKNKWMFVWDFDQTLTISHASDRPLPIPDEQIHADLVDVEFFRALTAHLHNQGHFIKLASFASGKGKDVIAAYLRYCFGPNESRPYLKDEGIAAYYPGEGVGKNGHIERLLQAAGSKVLSFTP